MEGLGTCSPPKLDEACKATERSLELLRKDFFGVKAHLRNQLNVNEGPMHASYRNASLHIYIYICLFIYLLTYAFHLMHPAASCMLYTDTHTRTYVSMSEGVNIYMYIHIYIYIYRRRTWNLCEILALHDARPMKL